MAWLVRFWLILRWEAHIHAHIDMVEKQAKEREYEIREKAKEREEKILDELYDAKGFLNHLKDSNIMSKLIDIDLHPHPMFYLRPRIDHIVL